MSTSSLALWQAIQLSWSFAILQKLHIYTCTIKGERQSNCMPSRQMTFVPSKRSLPTNYENYST